MNLYWLPMANLNLLLFFPNELTAFPSTWTKISPIVNIQEALCDVYPEQTKKIMSFNALYQFKIRSNCFADIEQILINLSFHFGSEGLGVNQTSGSLIPLQEIPTDITPLDFFLDFLVSWHLENAQVHTAGCGLIGNPDLVFKSDALEVNGSWFAEWTEWFLQRPDINSRPFIEWKDWGKFRIETTKGWERDDPYFNPAGTLKLIRSL